MVDGTRDETQVVWDAKCRKKMQHLEREITPQKCACTDFNHLFVKMIFDKVKIGTNLGIYFQLSV